MTDRERWDRAVAAVADEYAALSPPLLALLRESAERIRHCKRRIHAFAEQVLGAQICAECGGACCARGKFHFAVIDLLVYLVAGKELFKPCFGTPHCPYMNQDGCLMEPEFRPFNCVTFNCERIEGLFAPGEVAGFYLLEKDLRLLYAELEQAFENSIMRALLITSERDTGGMLRRKGGGETDGDRNQRPCIGAYR